MALRDNLVSWWELNETSGTRVDSHGGNDLTDNNTVGSATGIQGNAADFETTATEWLSITDASQTGLDITGDFTLSTWVKLESTGTGMLASKDQFDSSNQSWWWYTSSGDVFGRFSDDGTNSAGHVTNAAAAGVNMSTGTWYHLVMTYDASTGTARVYKDATYSTTTMSGTIGTSLNDNAIDFTIGRRTRSGTPEWYFDGLQDEVGIWTRILTDDEITEIYNSGSGLSYADTAAGSSIKEVNGLALASIKSWNGVILE